MTGTTPHLADLIVENAAQIVTCARGLAEGPVNHVTTVVKRGRVVRGT